MLGSRSAHIAVALLLDLTLHARAQGVQPPIIPPAIANLLPLNNTWTGMNTFTPSVQSSYTIPGMQVIVNVDYGSFGDTNTTFGLVVGGGKNVDSSPTTGSWQTFSARYTGFGGGDSSAFITAGQELMFPTASTNNNSGRFTGNNPECIIPIGMTPVSCVGEEIDIETLSNVSSSRHGLSIVDLGSTGSYATDDSGLSILSAGIGWSNGIEFGSQTGQFPVPAGGKLITTVPSTAALESAIYLQNLTGTPTFAWVMLPSNAKGVCFGVGNCAGGTILSTSATGGGSLVFANGDISLNFTTAEVTFTSGGSIQMLGGINAPNATGGAASKYICSDSSGNWFAQTAAC